jgi:transcriptional regulator with XRE-family HTH domain
VANRRRGLAERRKAVGLSQERLAEALGVDRSTVVRWERAGTDPQPWHRPRLANALRISVEDLADLLADPGTARAGPREPDRPDLTTIDTNDLDSLQSFRMADRRLGGGHLYAIVTGYLQRNVAPRMFSPAADGHDQPVFRAAAGLTEMAGWMAHDAGRDALAEQHFRHALGFARMGHDSHLAADICAGLSHLAHHRKRPGRALAYARQGHAELGSGSPHPGLEARLLAMQARSHAADRDHDRCMEHLQKAERALVAPQRSASSPWVGTFDEASLAAEAARCLRQLGQLDAARRRAARVLRLRPPERIRSRAFAQLMVVSILIAQGRVDEACAVAEDVLDRTRALGSILVVQQLETLGRRLAPFHRNTDVAAFVALLHAELHERRRLLQGPPPVTGQRSTEAS